MCNRPNSEMAKSKSQLKRDANALLNLGVKLVNLQQKNLDKIPLQKPIRDAIDEARKISAHGGLKRQQQYIAKLLRHIDTSAICEAIHQIQIQSSQINLNFKNTERWRERLINDEKVSLQEFINTYPNVDRQALRQLIRNTLKEISTGKPLKYYRELFRMLRDTIEQ